MTDASLIHLRRMALTDSELIYSWANDPVSRGQSFRSEAIAEEEHRKWFVSRLESPSTYYYLGELQEQPFGQIRFERQEEEAVIHFSIAPEFRGKGLGKILLREGIRLFSLETRVPIRLIAFVKNTNLPSLRIFQEEGFVREAATEYPDSCKFTMLIPNEFGKK
jgi:RimJ/RimL family protein N-acetyltransferase